MSYELESPEVGKSESRKMVGWEVLSLKLKLKRMTNWMCRRRPKLLNGNREMRSSKTRIERLAPWLSCAFRTPGQTRETIFLQAKKF